MTFRTWGTAVVAACLIAGAASACSSGGSSSSSSAAGGTASAAAGGGSGTSATLSGTPVEVNIVFPETGTFTFPEMGTAVEAAEKAVNDSGGINGRPLKVNICDTTSATDPNPTIACLRSVTANQNIVAELGDYSLFADIATPLENAAHLVQIGAPPLGVSQQELPNAYPLVMPEEEAFGAALVKIGATNPGLLYIDIPTAQKAFSQINAYLKAGGSSVKLTTSEPAPITSTDLSPAGGGAVQERRRRDDGRVYPDRAVSHGACAGFVPAAEGSDGDARDRVDALQPRLTRKRHVRRLRAAVRD